MNGFVATGIRPINREMVTRQIVGVVPNAQAELIADANKDKQHKEKMLNVLKNFLNERFPTMPLVPKSRRRKVQAAEGEILTGEESFERLRGLLLLLKLQSASVGVGVGVGVGVKRTNSQIL